MASQTSSALVAHDAGETIAIPGIQIISKVTKEMSGGAYSLFVNLAEPGSAVPMHTHLHDEETMVVLRGRIVCRLGEDTFNAGPGDTVHLPAGVPHGWSTDGEEPVELLVVFSLTPDSDYERMFRDLSSIDLEHDFEAGDRVATANGMRVPMPPVFVPTARRATR
jgi:quercetin dioxygenase-like cupin family protein